MSFSRNDEVALKAFAQQLGLPARLGPDGAYAFRFADDGVLSLVAARDGARICMTLERAGPHRDDAQHRALSRGGYDAALGLMFHVSEAADGSLLYTVALEGGRLSLPDIEACLQALIAKARG